MNILAVHPLYPGNKEIVYLPLGLGYITAVAEREGHDVTVFDMHNLRLSYGALESALARREYQACFMGGFAMQVKGMAKVTELIRKAQPDCKIILGGVGVSDIPEIALNYTRADAVANGEAENVLPALLQAIQERRPHEDNLGFVYRRGEEIITHRRRLEEVCRAVEPLGITWSTSGRADWATEDKLTRMKKAGCTYVLFGVESGSQTLLD